MLDLPGSLLKVLAPDKAYLLGETAQVCMERYPKLPLLKPLTCANARAMPGFG